ncbi:MAG: chorismate mutase [Oscillospiraceae bacterium]|nr:chorismate mutase [Oscillospiraceae bacterium]
MTDLENSRNEINRIDAEMARLFEARMNVCRDIAAYKKERGLSVRDTAREADLIEKNRQLIGSAELEPYYVQFLRRMIDLSCDYQSRLLNGMRVTYCGVEGAFAYIAARRMFPEAELVPFPSFNEAYQAVERGEYDCAVLPLENSYAGEVGAVMDLLFSGSLYVNQVLDLPISHNLLAVEGADLGSIRTVVSHPQALEQCGNYIRAHGFETEAYSNTALAAKFVKEQGDISVAAIASRATASVPTSPRSCAKSSTRPSTRHTVASAESNGWKSMPAAKQPRSTAKTSGFRTKRSRRCATTSSRSKGR